MDLVRDSRLSDRTVVDYEWLDRNKLRDIFRKPDIRRVGSVLDAFYDSEVVECSIYLPRKIVEAYTIIPLIALFKTLPHEVIRDLDSVTDGGIRFGREDFSVRRPEGKSEIIEEAIRNYVLEPSRSLVEAIPGMRKPVPLILGIRAES